MSPPMHRKLPKGSWHNTMVVDGYDAATFIQQVRSLIETPASLFIEADSF